MSKEGKASEGNKAGGDVGPPPVSGQSILESRLDAPTREIIHTTKRTGVEVRGPIPLPTRIAPAIGDGGRMKYLDKQSMRQGVTIASTEQHDLSEAATDQSTEHRRRKVSEADMLRAESHYLAHLKSTLEAEHLNRYVAVDVDDGSYVVATSRLAAQAAHKQAFGQDRVSCTFHIGTTR